MARLFCPVQKWGSECQGTWRWASTPTLGSHKDDHADMYTHPYTVIDGPKQLASFFSPTRRKYLIQLLLRIINYKTPFYTVHLNVQRLLRIWANSIRAVRNGRKNGGAREWGESRKRVKLLMRERVRSTTWTWGREEALAFSRIQGLHGLRRELLGSALWKDVLVSMVTSQLFSFSIRNS